MKRADWMEQLWPAIEAQRPLPFVWGGRGDSRDCCTFVATILDAISDGHYVDDLLANYHDEDTAKAYIEAAGGLQNAVSGHLGEPKRLAYMVCGDVAMILDRGRHAVGIFDGRYIVCADDRKLTHLRRDRALVAWGI